MKVEGKLFGKGQGCRRRMEEGIRDSNGGKKI
jgi:hypothetical protein